MGRRKKLSGVGGLGAAQGCLNFRLRKVARPLGRYYDEALRPSGLSISQFNILAALELNGATSISNAADLLAMERSAFARNLKPLVHAGFVGSLRGDDRRTRIVAVTDQGREKIAAALPLWHRAQSRLLEQLPAGTADEIERALGSVMSAVAR